MKHWIFYAAVLLLLSALGLAPFRGSDVAKLQPVEVLRVRLDAGKVCVETDTGDSGSGADLSAALKNLENTTAGDIFLETADYLILSASAVPLLPELTGYLRPGCGVCIEMGEPVLEEVSAFLSAHPPKVSLQDYRAERPRLPVLVTREEGMLLVQQ